MIRLRSRPLIYSDSTLSQKPRHNSTTQKASAAAPARPARRPKPVICAAPPVYMAGPAVAVLEAAGMVMTAVALPAAYGGLAAEAMVKFAQVMRVLFA